MKKAVKPKPKAYEFTLVEWMDACTSSGWSEHDADPIADNGVHPVCIMVSIGKLIFEDDAQIILAASFDDEVNNQRIAIPKPWLLRREVWHVG